MYNKDDAYKNLERINGWISNCDSKASVLIAVLGILIGCTSKIFESIKILKDLIEGNLQATTINITLTVFIIIFFLFYLFSIIVTVFHIVKTLYPKLDTKDFNEENLVDESILYFMNINNMGYKDFNKKTNIIDDKALLDDINSQCYINSCICSQKFIHVKKAIKWLIVTGGIAIILMIFIKLI